MTSLVSRRTTVRLIVLAVVAVLASTWNLASRRPDGGPQADAPGARTVLPVASPAAAPVPVPDRSESQARDSSAPAPVPHRKKKQHRSARHHKSHHHKSHHRKSHRAASRQHKAHHKAHRKAHHKVHHKVHRPAHHTGRSGHWANAGGRDISWPQCPVRPGRHGLGQPMPDPGVKFVVVGLTAGRAHTANPCLAEHLRWVRTHHVYASAYAFAAFPSRAQLRRHRHHGPYDGRTGFGALKNAGHAAAAYNIKVMRRHGFTTPHVWLDVEPSSSHPWSRRRQLNRAVVRGWIRGYRSAGYTVGFYSTPLLWRHILGNFRTGLPEWRTAGPASPRAALGRCSGESIQGGPAVVAQWWTSRRDFDRLCPGSSSSETLSRYFHKW